MTQISRIFNSIRIDQMTKLNFIAVIICVILKRNMTKLDKFHKY